MLSSLRLATCSRTLRVYRTYSTKTIETDELGVPLKPTWSVNELLRSYPSPKIAPDTLKKLHGLSALVPPQEGTLEHLKVTQDLEEMVRLVEAVRLVDTEKVAVAERSGPEDLDRQLYGDPDFERNSEKERGQDLLKHAARTANGFYVVEADRTRGGSV
ncbi:hypothetical protein FA15DRAFT_666848 [Coprinopsis marcescibilis]|uniref:Glutamyl-tRNA(Gln) amidotransferase subunit F, mitochondrial n=1 Tax=Coprinopsis marcescibilis TaxID=230819 RepID=A0A5C3L354_COPMA|nr:hypothetical protein FA15DRAFT_666848 [Coprinopsis marcescibilis]